jgi:hypothetical protein
MAAGSFCIASSDAAGIAALRLQDDGGLDAAGARLLGDDEAELGIGDDHRGGEQARAGDAVEYLLEGRRRADQRHELLRHLFARHRPQARAGAAAQYHRDNKLIRHAAISTRRAAQSRPGGIARRHSRWSSGYFRVQQWR